MRTVGILIVSIVLIHSAALQAATYELSFSTYLGGGDWEHARDVCVDGEGNVYVAGGTASADFPTTAGALQRTQDKTGAQVGS